MFSIPILITILATTVFNKIADKAGESVASGIIGNRADAVYCKLVGICKDKLKIMWSAGELPNNADLLKAVIESKLFASSYLCKAVENALTLQGGKEDDIKLLRKYFVTWHKEQINNLDSVDAIPPDDPVLNQIQSLLTASENQSTLLLRNKLMLHAKQAFLSELRTGMAWDGPALLEDMLMNGWEEDGKQMDWFDITTLQFGEILKNPKRPRVKEAFEARLLSDIKIDTQTILINTEETLPLIEASTADIKAHIDGRWNDVESWLKDIYDLLGDIKQDTSLIPEIKNVVESIRDNQKQKTFVASDYIKPLINEITTHSEYVRRLQAEYLAAKQQCNIDNSSTAFEYYMNAERKWANAVTILTSKEKQLQEVRDYVMRTYDLFKGIDWKTASERLKQARVLFENGEYDNVRRMMETEEREKERNNIEQEKEQATQRALNMAEEDLIHAKTVLMDTENPYRYKEADAIYDKSVTTHAYFTNCFEYANYLQAQKQYSRAIPYYWQALQWLKNYDGSYIHNKLSIVATTLNNIGASLAQNNQAEQAFSAFNETLNINRKMAEKNPDAFLPNVAMTLNNIGNLLKNNNQAEQAFSAYNEALQIRRKLAEKNSDVFLPYVATTLNNIGVLLANNNQVEQAFSAYNEALQIRRKLVEKNPDAFLPYVAIALNNIGTLLAQNNQAEQAFSAFNEALQIRRKLAEKNPDAFLPDVATTLNNIGNLFNNNNQAEQAFSAFNEALQIRKKLAEKNPDAFLPDVATTLNNIGILLTNNNQAEQAFSAFNEALQIRRKLAEKNPDAFLPYVATILNNIGALLKGNNQAEQAFSMYNEALQIRRKLAEKNPDAFLPDVATTLNNIGNLLKNNNQAEQAFSMYNEALQIRRKLAEKNPDAFLPDVATTLNNIGILLTNNNQAEQAFNEALQIRRKLAEKNPDAFLPYVAMTLAARGISLIGESKKADAKIALLEAMNIFKVFATKNPERYNPYVEKVITALKSIE